MSESEILDQESLSEKIPSEDFSEENSKDAVVKKNLNFKLLSLIDACLKNIDDNQKLSDLLRLSSDAFLDKIEEFRNRKTPSNVAATSRDSEDESSRLEESETISVFPSTLPQEVFSNSSETGSTFRTQKSKRKSTSVCSKCSYKENDISKYEVVETIGKNLLKKRLFKNLVADYTKPENACLRIPIKEKTPKSMRVASEAPLSMRLSAIAEYQLYNTIINVPAFEWSAEQVAYWVAFELRLPQYRRAFLKNCIQGRHLVMMNAESLEEMGIRNFNDVTKISRAIRRMFKLGKEVDVNLELTQGRFDPATLFAMYNFKSGSPQQIAEFYRRHNIVLKKNPLCSLFEIKRTDWDLFPKTVAVASKRRFVLDKQFESYPEDKKERPPPQRLW